MQMDGCDIKACLIVQAVIELSDFMRLIFDLEKKRTNF